MDPFFREAVEKYLTDGTIDQNVLKTSEKRENFKKFCRNLQLQPDGILLYKSRKHEIRPVPTPDEISSVLVNVHVADNGLHRKDQKAMITALSNSGYAYPAALGGLASVVGEYV